MPFDDSDRGLVDRVKAGDASAFGTLHRRYYTRIYRFAYLRTHNVEDATDIASETFCRALQRIGGYEFRRSDSLYPWLHQIASNLVIDRHRAQPAGRELSLDAQLAEDVESFLNCLPDDSPSAYELLARKEVQEMVSAAIEQLPADQAKAVVYRFVGDLSIREIARAMDRSEGAIKSLLHRALQTLRERLKEHTGAARATAAQGASAARHAVQPQKDVSHARETLQIHPRDTR